MLTLITGALIFMVIEIKPIYSLVIYIDIESNHRITPNLAPAA